MDKQFSDKLDKEINLYLNALRHFARVCDWKSFKSHAAMLFEYLESAEVLLLKRKFYRIIAIILAALVAAFACFNVLRIIGVSFFTYYQDHLTLIILAGCVYELILLLEFRMYMHRMMSQQERRKGHFIRGIEDDAKANLGRDTCTTVS